MSYAIVSGVFEQASSQDVDSLIQEAKDLMQLRQAGDYCARVMLLATEPYKELVEDMAHHCVGQTRCLNLWGGCVSGLWVDGTVHTDQPALVLAIFGAGFESTRLREASGNGNSASSLTLMMCDSDHENPRFNPPMVELTQTVVNTSGVGVLSYGANYAPLPRIEKGRLSVQSFSEVTLAVKNPLTLNSEGLEFLSEPQTVTECAGLFLLKADNKSPASALNSPQEQTTPIGLRLQVIHDGGESWIPVTGKLADGTLSLAAPVELGQKVRLARRHTTSKSETLQLLERVQGHFGAEAPGFAIIFSGLERSQRCHPELPDFESLALMLPSTEIIGILGQAVWLESDHENVHPPRNNRLAACFFNAPS